MAKHNEPEPLADIDGTGATFEPIDNGDSIVLLSKIRVSGIEAEIDVRLGSAELDELMARIATIREKRGI